jgi:hypothetical protein
MPERDFFDECYRTHRPRPARSWPWTRRFINWLATASRRAIAKPAQSAVAIMAIGVIVGSVLHMIIGRSGPTSAAGSVVHPETATEPIRPQPTRTVPAPSYWRQPDRSGKDAPIEAPDIDLFEPAIPGLDVS